MQTQTNHAKVCENCGEPFNFFGSAIAAMSRRFCCDACRLDKRKRQARNQIQSEKARRNARTN